MVFLEFTLVKNEKRKCGENDKKISEHPFGRNDGQEFTLSNYLFISILQTDHKSKHG